MYDCPNCQGTYSDPEGTYVAHGCPNCGYREQPVPIKDEMTHGLDAMPTSTQDDMSGNPLKEGILADGGWQNRQVRDESYASVRTANHAFIVSEDGKVFSQPHPATHENIAAVLGDAQRHLTHGAKGVILPNGYYQVHDYGTTHSPEVIDTTLRHHFGDHIMKSTFRQANNQEGYLPYWMDKTADKETPSSIDSIGIKDDDPEKIDQKEVNDGDHSQWQKDQDVGEGGADSAIKIDFDPEGPGLKSFNALLPLIQELIGKGETGENHPMIMELHKLLDSEVPGYLDGGEEHHHKQTNVLGDVAQIALPAAAMAGGVLLAPETGGASLVPAAEAAGGAGALAAVRGAMTKILPKAVLGIGAKDVAKGVGKNMLYHELGNGVRGLVDGGDEQAQPVQTPVRDTWALSSLKEANPYGVPNPGSVPNAAQQFPTPNQTTQSKCAGCGSTIDPSMTVCPQCGAPSSVLPGQAMNKPAAVTSAAHQGPHTPEQISAVQQVLINEGRVTEIPDVPLHPELYADEMAKVQQVEPPPEDVTNEMAPPPPPQMPPEGPNPNMPMPGMSVPPGQAMSNVIKRFASDSIAGQCPKCDSHTTALMTDDGVCHCHNCGNSWKDGDVITETVFDHKKSADQGFDNTVGVDAAHQNMQEDVMNENDTSHSWLDSSGDPLKTGIQYKVYSDKFSIPDIMRVLKVRPNSIQVEETGTYGLGFKHDITNDERQLDGLRFEAISDADPTPTGPTDTDSGHNDPRAGVAPGETSDLSTPHTTLSALASEWLENEKVSAQPDPDLYPGGAHPSERHQPGKHQLPPVTRYMGTPEVLCPTCKGNDLNCPQCHGNAYLPMGTEGVMTPDNVTAYDGGISRENWGDITSIRQGKTAGASYTRTEQRELIDEKGKARNSDKMNLARTHYRIDDDEDDSFLFGL